MLLIHTVVKSSYASRIFNASRNFEVAYRNAVSIIKQREIDAKKTMDAQIHNG